MTSITLPQVYRNSRLRFVLVLLMAAVFAVIGYGMALGEGPSRWLGWGILLFFGAGFCWCLRELFDRSPRLTLTATGVTDRRLPVGEIAWADIAGATLRSRRGNHYIFLALRNPDPYLAHLPPTRRRATEASLRTGGPALYLDLTATTANPTATLASVQQLAGLPPQ